jgi:uncharacterized protein
LSISLEDVHEFIGRKRELQFLTQALDSKASAFVPIYGRRRVGKSELILELLRGRRALYLVGKKAPAPLQLKELLREAAHILAEPLIAELPADDWKRALLEITARWPRDEKIILAFDEFQWLAAADGSLTSVLQECWDRHWRDSGRVMLILCGSFVGFMEREVLGRSSPLFGRRTGQIHLLPFGFLEASRFHDSYSLLDRARTYFVCGGVPAYLRAFDSARSVEQNIQALILDELGQLGREPEFLLKEELRDVETYYAVIMAVAAGEGSIPKIARVASVPERSLHYNLKQLTSLGYLARRFPLTGSKPNRRQLRYIVDDPLLRFWFRFVYPNMSFIQHMGPRVSLLERVKPGLDSFFGDAFERLCREALPLIYFNEGVSTNFEVGEYWDRSTQIDVVGRRDDGWTDLGECKWGTLRSAKALIAELEGKIERYPNKSGATIGRRYFLRQRPPRGFPTTPRGTWYDLESLYGL